MGGLVVVAVVVVGMMARPLFGCHWRLLLRPVLGARQQQQQQGQREQKRRRWKANKRVGGLISGAHKKCCSWRVRARAGGRYCLAAVTLARSTQLIHCLSTLTNGSPSWANVCSHRKTSILNRFLFKKFETKYKPTVEDLFSQDFDLGSIEIKVSTGRWSVVLVCIWLKQF